MAQKPYYCSKCSKKHYRGNIYKDHKKFALDLSKGGQATPAKKRKSDLKRYNATLVSGKLFNKNGKKYYLFKLHTARDRPMDFVIALTAGQINKIDYADWYKEIRDGRSVTICQFKMSSAWMAKLIAGRKMNYRPKQRKAVLTY